MPPVQVVHDPATAGQPRPRPYGNLVQLNTKRLIADSVGADVLAGILADFLNLVESSAAVYEANGDYAASVFGSGWCRFLEARSRCPSETGGTTESRGSGTWHCHESCWAVARASIRQGKPVDCPCVGGIRILAVPIRADGEIVGTINFAYGAPPRDPQRLQQIADRYGVAADALRKKAESHEPRPHEILEIAKRRLQMSAKLIGVLVERKRIEAGLRRMSKVFLEAADPIVLKDLEGRVVDVNREAERVFGWSRGELVGRPIKTLFSPEWQEQADRQLKRCKRGEHVRNVEASWRAKSGEMIPVLLTLSLLTDETGQAAAVATTAKDIRERKRLREQLRDARLATVGKLVATIAHELRNPLSVVGNAVFYLNRKVPETEPKWKEYLGIIQHEVRTCEQIIANLLGLTRAREPERETLDLGALARDVFRRGHVPEAIHWQVRCEPDPFLVSADKVQLGQVLGNLLTNALQCLAGHGTITVTARRDPEADALVFEDNGPGIEKEHRASIFEPFFSTKAKGTGLGLWISAEIVQRHGGSIELMERPGRGAAFRIRLPRPATAPTDKRTPP